MSWITLESEMLAAVAYDAANHILYLRFRNTGDVYRYFEVPSQTIRSSSQPSPMAASSLLTSGTASPMSAWRNSAPLN